MAQHDLDKPDVQYIPGNAALYRSKYFFVEFAKTQQLGISRVQTQHALISATYAKSTGIPTLLGRNLPSKLCRLLSTV